MGDFLVANCFCTWTARCGFCDEWKNGKEKGPTKLHLSEEERRGGKKNEIKKVSTNALITRIVFTVSSEWKQILGMKEKIKPKVFFRQKNKNTIEQKEQDQSAPMDYPLTSYY